MLGWTSNRPVNVRVEFEETLHTREGALKGITRWHEQTVGLEGQSASQQAMCVAPLPIRPTSYGAGFSDTQAGLAATQLIHPPAGPLGAEKVVNAR